MQKKAQTNKIALAELLSLKIGDSKDLMRAKRKIAKKYGLKIFTNAEILKALPATDGTAGLRRLLRKRAVRTMSGIAPVAVLTKPFPCPGKCAYCPAEKGVPQSYLSNEPAVMRAIRCGYQPFVQVQDRLRALAANGHEPNKIELIVIGGTWSYLPEKYKYWYVLNLFAGANRFKVSDSKSPLSKKSGLPFSLSIKKIKEKLALEQKKNEKALYRIIGLTLETRPDYINEKELLEMRALGCTRVEIGVQHLDDKILKLNRRGHDVKAIADATALLKDFGFKITYHIMPGLPGATLAKDYAMYKRLFADARFQPDQIKFYPCVVVKGSLLYRWWQQGKYQPYSDKQLQDLIIKCKRITPEYVRIIRLIRDIPGESIVAGNLITNLRQILQDKGIKCRCIRCREIKNYEVRSEKYEVRINNYIASGGEEYFIQAVTADDKYLLGFCRLRVCYPIGKETEKKRIALIRELHVYGELVPVGQGKKVQHAGLGKKLLAEAEKIAKNNNCVILKVISGIGVRDYYRKQGYRLKNTYLEKKLNI